jgi:hypothetical protein
VCREVIRVVEPVILCEKEDSIERHPLAISSGGGAEMSWRELAPHILRTRSHCTKEIILTCKKIGIKLHNVCQIS